MIKSADTENNRVLAIEETDNTRGYDVATMFGEEDSEFNGGSLVIWIAIGMALGTGLGAAFGVVLDNIGLGIAMGISMGTGLGAAMGVAFGARFTDE